MQVLGSEWLKQLVNGKLSSGDSLTGVVYLQSYSISKTKNGGEYVNGTLVSGISVNFKAWGSTSAFTKLKNNDFSNNAVFISGVVNNYNGIGTIQLDDINAVSGFDESDFLETVYNKDSYWNALNNLMSSSLSEKGYNLFKNILSGDLLDRFNVEFAASSHHDNCKNGLLAHTYKCASLMTWVVNSYPNLISIPNSEGVLTISSDRKDLLLLGAVLHDIGKTVEMHNGVYQPESRVTHRYLGTEILSKHKDNIIACYGDIWYYDLISVLLQHHDEFGDPSKTLASYIVSKVDLLESQMTYLNQVLKTSISDGSSGLKINFDGKWFNV